MRYTRYDYGRRRKSDIPMPVMFIVILLFAILMGSFAFNLLFKSSSGSDVKKAVPASSNQTSTKPSSNKNSTPTSSSTENASFIVVQAGYFSEKNNANTMEKDLKQAVNPFVIKDKGKYRVLCGIYNTSDYDMILEKLKKEKISPARMTYNISVEDDTTKLISEMIKGNLKILTEFVKADVKYDTGEFIKWTNNLKHEEKGSRNYKIFEDYKAYINKLPKEMKREDCEDNYTYIYKLLTEIASTK